MKNIYFKKGTSPRWGCSGLAADPEVTCPSWIHYELEDKYINVLKLNNLEVLQYVLCFSASSRLLFILPSFNRLNLLSFRGQ